MNVSMLISPRWSKIIRDLWKNKARTMLVMLAGVFAFSFFPAMRATRVSVREALAYE